MKHFTLYVRPLLMDNKPCVLTGVAFSPRYLSYHTAHGAACSIQWYICKYYCRNRVNE